MITKDYTYAHNVYHLLYRDEDFDSFTLEKQEEAVDKFYRKMWHIDSVSASPHSISYATWLAEQVYKNHGINNEADVRGFLHASALKDAGLPLTPYLQSVYNLYSHQL